MRKLTALLAGALSLFGVFLLYSNAQGGQPLTLNQAMALDKEGKHNESIEALNQIISQSTENERSKAYLSLGLVYFRSGEYDEALVNFTRSAAINKNNPMSFYFTGMIYEKKALGTPTPNAAKTREFKTLALKAWQDYLGSVDANKERIESHGNLGITIKESIRRAQKHVEILQEGLRDE